MCLSIILSKYFHSRTFSCNCDLQGQVHELKFLIQKKSYSFIMHRFIDTDTLKHYIVTVTLQGHLKSKVTMSTERLYLCPIYE